MTILGAVCWPEVPPERLRDVALVAEETGLDELWLWEDCFWGGAVPACAAALAWTTSLRVGIGVLPVPLRNVATAAMEAAMRRGATARRGSGTRGACALFVTAMMLP